MVSKISFLIVRTQGRFWKLQLDFVGTLSEVQCGRHLDSDKAILVVDGVHRKARESYGIAHTTMRKLFVLLEANEVLWFYSRS